MRIALLACLLALSVPSGAQAFPPQKLTAAQDSILARYVTNGAERYSYLGRQWQQQLDSALAADSTIGQVWQLKAMPLFKTRKYEAGMAWLDKAVRHDSSWLDYRAFIKCIFSKQYRSALEDFNACPRFGYVMDHSYDLYRALCHLQLNEFDTALRLLETQIADDDRHDRAHHFNLFYLGIAYFETEQYDKAIAAFDRAIGKYSKFSDAYYYKARCLGRTGREKAAMEALQAGKALFDKDYTINEDNSFYELYPYQVTWQWRAVKGGQGKNR